MGISNTDEKNELKVSVITQNILQCKLFAKLIYAVIVYKKGPVKSL